MTLVLIRPPQANEKPIHVLVVVVGKYIHKDNLRGAGLFTQEVVEFWTKIRQFAQAEVLSTIDVLASDPDGLMTVCGDRGAQTPDRPNLTNCQTALRGWADRIAKTRGVGFLHWIGHGQERAANSNALTDVVTLYVEGSASSDPNSQQALDWTKVLWKINEITATHPVYCFIDACRVDNRTAIQYPGLVGEDCNPAFHEGAIVFRSALPGDKAYWLSAANPAVKKAGGAAQAIGTRAFLASLESFGARFQCGARLHPILAAEIVEASSALLSRWLNHQGLPCGETTGPRNRHKREILYTEAPQSVVEIQTVAPSGSTQCTARVGSSHQSIPSENGKIPFEFRLKREPHIFDFDVGTSHGPRQVIYSSVRL